jgi:outer membrane protein assembly factor BamB
MRWLLGVIAAGAMAGPMLAADQKLGLPVGVAIVSPDVKVIYAPAKGGGIEALDLATGKVIWTNKDAHKLAGVTDKFVFTWTGDDKKAHVFRVLAVDAATGKTIGRSDPITLPEWASTQKTWGRTFRIAAKADGDGALVYWHAGAFYAGGARPSPEIEAAARKNEFGVTKIDFKTGKTTLTNAKPKDEDFQYGPGAFHDKIHDYEFVLNEEIPGFRPGVGGMMTKVTLIVRKNDQDLWKRELAGNPFSPPPP